MWRGQPHDWFHSMQAERVDDVVSVIVVCRRLSPAAAVAGQGLAHDDV
jgi:hypothetical protein